MREPPDRRGRSERGSVGLLEREVALRAIEIVLDSAREGHGRALLFEGHAGIGKTRLHEAALDEARGRGMRVLRAAGAELERNVALGVASQLLDAQLRQLPSTRSEALIAQAPDGLRALVGGHPRPAEVGAVDLSISHALFNLLATADGSRPALIAIDDLHWGDPASLEFIVYLLHRLEELPMALVLSWRHTVDEPQSPILDRISTHPRVTTHILSPLGPEAVKAVAAETLGELADEEVAVACYAATAGNPFYVRELLLALEREQVPGSRQLAERARALVPDAVIRTLRVRVGRIGAEGVALARALAVLGDDVPLRHAAPLAGLSLEAASDAADALAAAEILLAREPLRFAHPLVRSAIQRDIPAGELSSGHLEAARLLLAERAPAERVAAHLLLGRAQGADWVVEQLREAAREARRRGAPDSAARYLQRALGEPPARHVIGDVLAELGSAESAAGAPDASKHLEQAIDATSDPHRRAELSLELGHTLYNEGRYAQAAAAYDRGVAELGGAREESPERRELHDELQMGYTVAAGIVDELRPQALERSRQLLSLAASEGFPTRGQRLLLAQASMHAALAGEPAGRVLELAERAWDGGRLLARETSDGMAWLLVGAAITQCGELDRAIELADAVIADAQQRSSPLAFATASYFRATPKRWRGEITDALADLEQARDARRYGWRRFTRSAAASYCLCLIETGELDRAEAALLEDSGLEQPRGDLEDARRLFALAELRLAQGEPDAALEYARRAGTEIERSAKVWWYCPWHCTATEALIALGRTHEALELARFGLDLAERTGGRHAQIRAFRLLGLCDAEEQRMPLLRRAAALAREGPPTLEGMRALLELGAALRRANHRAAAREPLQQAADLARRGGATMLHDRARTELMATGARPRREALTSGVESLTPSERRIADLAADGHSNRSIAQILFVTPKTVEYHLRNVYRKLDIASRRELAGVLSAEDRELQGDRR
jgi:DNA-binding CsgD family transcriptional regulator